MLALQVKNIDNAIDATSTIITSNPSICLANADAQTLVDQIYTEFLLNNLQRLVMEPVLDHVIHIKTRFCAFKNDQLFLYVKGKRGMGKSRVIKALQFEFLLLE